MSLRTQEEEVRAESWQPSGIPAAALGLTLRHRDCICCVLLCIADWLPLLLGPRGRMRPVAGTSCANPIHSLPETDRHLFLSSTAKLRKSSHWPILGQVSLDRGCWHSGFAITMEGGEWAVPRRREGSIPRSGRNAKLPTQRSTRTRALSCEWRDSFQRRRISGVDTPNFHPGHRPWGHFWLLPRPSSSHFLSV